MKKFIISWILPYIIELLIKVLKDLASESTNKIDDNLIVIIEENQQDIIDGIKRIK